MTLTILRLVARCFTDPRESIMQASAPSTYLCTLRKHYQKAGKDCPTSSAEERWNHTREATYDSAMCSFGKKERQIHNWFEAGIAEFEPAFEAKRTGLQNYKRQRSEEKFAAHRNVRNNAQQITRRCANDSWLNRCHVIQLKYCVS